MSPALPYLSRLIWLRNSLLRQRAYSALHTERDSSYACRGIQCIGSRSSMFHLSKGQEQRGSGLSHACEWASFFPFWTSVSVAQMLVFVALPAFSSTWAMQKSENVRLMVLMTRRWWCWEVYYVCVALRVIGGEVGKANGSIRFFSSTTPLPLAHENEARMKTSLTANLAAVVAFTAAAPANNDHIRRANDLGHHVNVRCDSPRPSATGTGASIPMSTGTAPSIAMSTSTSTSSSSYPVDGAVVCNGMDFFGLCNHGHVVWQRVAEGMGCVDGKVVGVGDYTGVPMAT